MLSEFVRYFPLSQPHAHDRRIRLPQLEMSGSAVAPQRNNSLKTPVRVAVIAHVRHVETDYDTLLGRGMDRYDARRRVQARIEQVLADLEARYSDVTG